MSRKITSVSILTGAVAPGPAPEKHAPWGAKRTFHAEGITSSGAGTADIDIEYSNTGDDNTWVLGATISLVLTDANKVGDGFTADSPWVFVRANVTGLTGTGATVNVQMGTDV